ncbi:dynamin family protein [Bacillus sp. FSL K6-3431]|uniref:dynamin family protein n=1 Tax=Bacillus sp. FSL K6-3431 TaxID=2921500 RepID=UPI0030FB308A
MVNILEEITKDSQLQKTLTLLERFQQNGDDIRVEKAKNLLKKMHEKEFITAFSGHFSAGKSTMINALIGDQVLPSSPIPTSANLVKVLKSAEDYAKVYSHSQKTLLFQAPYDFATVKEYCKNGDVTNIEIGKKDSLLPKGVTIMDTPGVDSTDDAHRITTESALHLADIVFYVMDYNHVQSELNFMYTKNLLKHGVKLYLIINQIDKHNEQELSFTSFKKSVHDSFASWHVEPAGIYFTTLKKLKHPDNEFTTIKALIDHAFSHHNDLMQGTIDAAFNRLVAEHEAWLQDEMDIAAQPYEQVITEYSDEELQTLFTEETELTTEKEKILKTATNWERAFEKEREVILKNAYLMPYETRELAEQYLISAQSDFKMGFLFSKKKTEDERSERLQSFYISVKKQVESQINWHLKQLAVKKLEETELFEEKLQAAAQQMEITFEASFLTNAVHRGAGINGEYLLHYCEEIASRLRNIAMKTSDQFKIAVAEVLQTRMDKKLIMVNKHLSKIEKGTSALRSLIELEKKCDRKKGLLFIPSGKEEAQLLSLARKWEKELLDVTIYDDNAVNKPEMIPAVTESKKEYNTNLDTSIDMKKMIEKLDRAVTSLSGIKGFNRMTEQLSEKRTRLKHQNFTISLFGAFSAGKSSFANALLGESVLPVSPNPTTAAINRICPPTKENLHGTAIVRLKEADQLLADINESLLLFDYASNTLEEAFTIVPKVLSNHQGEGKEKIHLSFLTAFIQGFDLYREKLGTAIKTNLEGFQSFVANETQSCFVEAIDLFYDCSFTKKGITLVDTPGADSINARHTGVAFEYIKDSDAILFVTYYNHAFSKADREFLIQLGRVKDAFELDKMFFIVNAIDLASSEEEVSEVLTYVKRELTKNGIRFPKIYGISSKLALIAGERKASNLKAFISDFNHFLDKELTAMAINSADKEYQRVLVMLEQLIQSANEDESIKTQRKEALISTREKIDTLLLENKANILSDRLKQETKELLFYVKQRVFFRFPDFFKEAFNPAVLQGNSRELLKKPLEELLATMGYDFAQEMRATSLRLEQFTKKLLQGRFGEIEKELQALQSEIMLSQLEISKGVSPDFSAAFVEVERKPLEIVFKYFKNPKGFFENNEKKRMEEALRDLLAPLADGYIAGEHAKLNAHYEVVLNAEFSKMKDRVIADVNEQYDAWIDALSDSNQLPDWIKTHSVLLNH